MGNSVGRIDAETLRTAVAQFCDERAVGNGVESWLATASKSVLLNHRKGVFLSVEHDALCPHRRRRHRLAHAGVVNHDRALRSAVGGDSMSPRTQRPEFNDRVLGGSHTTTSVTAVTNSPLCVELPRCSGVGHVDAGLTRRTTTVVLIGCDDSHNFTRSGGWWARKRDDGPVSLTTHACVCACCVHAARVWTHPSVAWKRLLFRACMNQKAATQRRNECQHEPRSEHHND